MKKILILGGTGFVGRHVCEKLARVPCRVTLVTRRDINASHLQMLPMINVVSADIHDTVQLERLVAGHDAVINLIAILHGNEASFTQVHVEFPEKLAHACRAAGVKRLIHISALGASLKASSMYQRSKARGELVLRTAGLDLTLLRPSVIFGAGDQFLTLFAKLQQLFWVTPLAGANTRFQPVWVQDVAQAVVRCLQDDATIGQTYELYGPDVFTLREMVRYAGCLSGAGHGRGRPVLALSDSLARLQVALLSLAPGTPLMSQDNLASMKTDNVSDGFLPGLKALGITPTSLPAIAPSYLSPRGLRSPFQELRKSAGRS